MNILNPTDDMTVTHNEMHGDLCLIYIQGVLPTVVTLRDAGIREHDCPAHMASSSSPSQRTHSCTRFEMCPAK